MWTGWVILKGEKFTDSFEKEKKKPIVCSLREPSENDKVHLRHFLLQPNWESIISF